MRALFAILLATILLTACTREVKVEQPRPVVKTVYVQDTTLVRELRELNDHLEAIANQQRKLNQTMDTIEKNYYKTLMP